MPGSGTGASPCWHRACKVDWRTARRAVRSTGGRGDMERTARPVVAALPQPSARDGGGSRGQLTLHTEAQDVQEVLRVGDDAEGLVRAPVLQLAHHELG